MWNPMANKMILALGIFYIVVNRKEEEKTIVEATLDGVGRIDVKSRTCLPFAPCLWTRKKRREENS